MRVESGRSLHLQTMGTEAGDQPFSAGNNDIRSENERRAESFCDIERPDKLYQRPATILQIQI